MPIIRAINLLSERLKGSDIKLVTVESCTGGWIGKSITDIEGSSEWYEAGFITYSNEAKNKLVNVSNELLDNYGAVSIQVAEAMALGALNQFPNAVSVSVTGIAGPGGGSKDKPVGMVCIACCYGEKVISKRFDFSGDRNEIREQSVEEAVEMVFSLLDNF